MEERRPEPVDLDTAAGLRRAVAVSVAAAALVAVLWAVGWLPLVERTGWDLLLRLPSPEGEPAGPFAAVLIDDPSLARYGPVPWSRERLARLVEGIDGAGATAVVIDILLVEPRDPDGDEALAAVLSSGRRVLAASLSPNGGWLLPLERFGGAERAAHAHAEVAADGVVRAVSATKQADGLVLPALAVEAARRAGAELPDRPGRLLRPDFRQGPREIPAVSAIRLLDPGEKAPSLAGKVVFVGMGASGASDQMFVPVGVPDRPAPGVLVHASMAASIHRGGLLVAPSWWIAALGAFAAAGATQLLRSRSGRLRPGDPALALAAVAVAGVLLLWSLGALTPLASLSVAVLVAVVLREATESRLAQRETGWILTALLDEEGFVRDLPAGAHDRLRLARRLQAQLARDRDLRRTLLEGLSEGVVLWDAVGDPLMSNRAAAELWGHVPSRAEIEAGRADERLIERRGRTLEVALRALSSGWLGLLRDVTDRVALEQRRREMQRLVSHELKTPLASIAGFGEMLATYDLTDEELRRVAGLIRSEADRLGEMVRAFLDLERMGAGAWDGEAKLLDLSALVAGRCELLRPAAAARGQRLEVDVATGLEVRGVERLLGQLVDNLVGNALKYAHDGGRIAVEAAALGREGGARLVVTDDGPGIPANAVPHLFERFYRVPGTRREGSGLGLAVVKEVADWHGAAVSVDTAPGRGTRMTVAFEPPQRQNREP